MAQGKVSSRKGTHYHKSAGKYVANILIKNKLVNLGYYKLQRNAKKAHLTAESLKDRYTNPYEFRILVKENL
ncbi:MAG: hypothetical protein NTW30_05570 [Candidatus Aenigmarchaeota archaeon]|nr:hypothetical protein [Candidatus Aenigmarchaeota archaeon]